MKETICALYRGNMIPCEHVGIDNKEIACLEELIEKNRGDLCRELSDEQKEILQKYDDCINEMSDLINEEYFIYGYRMGARLTVEAFSND